METPFDYGFQQTFFIVLSSHDSNEDVKRLIRYMEDPIANSTTDKTQSMCLNFLLSLMDLFYVAVTNIDRYNSTLIEFSTGYNNFKKLVESEQLTKNDFIKLINLIKGSLTAETFEKVKNYGYVDNNHTSWGSAIAKTEGSEMDPFKDLLTQLEN